MDSTAAPNQGYWFVLREDQGNVIFSTNSIQAVVHPEPQVGTVSESRYIVDSSSGRLYSDPAPATTAAGAAAAAAAHDTDCDWDEQTKAKDFWDTTKIKLLLTLSLEYKATQWDDVSAMVGASPDVCSNKYRQLRRTYLRLLRNKRQGKEIKWTHYNACEEVFTLHAAVPAASAQPAAEPWDEQRVRALLARYIDHLPRFRNPNVLHKDLWKSIATHLGTTSYSAYHKFKNMNRSYLKWRRQATSDKQTKAQWPYEQYFERIYHNYSPKQRPWERNKIKALLKAYADIAHKFRNPKLQKKELWKEIAKNVGESPATCDRKYRNLKQTYMKLKDKVDNGRTTKWRYYKDFEDIYENATRYIDMDGSKIVYREPECDYIAQLLAFYIHNKDKFRDPLTKNKTIWRKIAPRLGLTAEECDKKFRNLKQTYIRLAWKKKKTGECGKWPYFSQFESIFSSPALEGVSEDCCDDVALAAAGDDVDARRCHRDKQFLCLAAAAEQSNRLQRERNDILRDIIQRNIRTTLT